MEGQMGIILDPSKLTKTVFFQFGALSAVRSAVDYGTPKKESPR